MTESEVVVGEVVHETKPFYKTSEFWVVTAGQLLLWVGLLPTDGAPPWFKTVVSAAGVVAYMLARGVAKSGTPRTVLTPGQGSVEGLTQGIKAQGYDPPSPGDEQKAASALGSTHGQPAISGTTGQTSQVPNLGPES